MDSVRAGKGRFGRIVCAAAMVCVCAFSSAEAEVIDKILIVVNGEVITRRELERVIRPVYEKYRYLYQDQELARRMDEAQNKIIEQLVEDRLILSEAKRLAVTIEEKEVDAKIKDAQKRFASAEQFERALLEQRMTLNELRTRIRSQLMVRRLIDEKVGSRVVLLPNEVAAYYAEHKDEYAQPATIKVRSIVVKSGPERDIESAGAMARKIREEIAGGANFSHLARQYSEGPHASEGGLMGPVKRGDLLPEIESTVFALKPGETTEVFEKNGSFYIFQVDEKKEGKARSLAEAHEEIEDRLFNEKARARLKTWIDSLKANAYIEYK